MGVERWVTVACGVALVGMLAACQSVRSAEARGPARVIVDGVRASRLPLREGHIEFHVRDELPRDSRVVEYTLEIDWKDDSLRSTERVGSTVRRCAVRHNGEVLFRQEPRDAFLDDPAKYSGYLFLFDPRLLGAHPLLLPSQYAGQCLFPNDGWEATVAKEVEVLDGRECVVVRWAKYGVVQKYWIEQAGAFRVRRIYDYNNQTQFDCTYSGADVLPQRVVVTRETLQGELYHKAVFTVLAVRLGPVPPEVFTLAGLHLEVGAAVVDQRLHERVGYWNGTGLSKSRKEALLAAAPPLQAERSLRFRVLLLLIGVGALVAIFFLARRCRNKAEVRS